MLQLSPDECYNFELLRLLAHSSYGGVDVGEVLSAAAEIEPGDFESWYQAFYRRAERVLAASVRFHNPVSVRDANFRAATYFRAADFFLHGNWEDPRIMDLWEKQTACFDKAMSLLDVPGYRESLPAGGFEIPIIFFPASRDKSARRPTVILGNGFDGSMEEMYHLHGAAALERGYNVVCYDGPGQPLVRREQGLGFTHAWEKVVGPVLDYLETLPNVDMERVALVGYSMADVLAARAAALDHRVKALLQIDGLYDFADTPVSKAAGSTFGNLNDVESTRIACSNLAIPAGLRWALSHGLWSFKVQTRGEFLLKVKTSHYSASRIRSNVPPSWATLTMTCSSRVNRRR
jgi:hypothetical protein